MTPEYERLVRERVYVPEQGSIVGRTLLHKQVVHIQDVLEDPAYALPDLQRLGGYRTALGVPMMRDGGPTVRSQSPGTRCGPSPMPRSG